MEMVRVRDLSEGGAKIECSRHFKPGTQVVLDTAKTGEVTGKIVWSKDGRAGIDFDIEVVLKFDAKPVKLKTPKSATYRRPTLMPQITAKPAKAEDWQ